MLLLFNSKNKNERRDNEAEKRITESAVNLCKRYQQNWSNWLQHKTERLSATTRLSVLIAFCALTSVYNLYLLTVNCSGKQRFNLFVTTLKKPAFITKSGDENTKPAAITTNEGNKRIENFKRYMDSLARSPAGKKNRDSILSLRPELMDSILFIENMYQSHSKK